MSKILKYYSNKNFNRLQLYSIKTGLNQGVDIRFYAKKGFDYEQMECIRLGLMEGLDVSIYAKENYSLKDMENVKKAIKIDSSIVEFIDIVHKDKLPTIAYIKKLGYYDLYNILDKNLEELLRLKETLLNKRIVHILNKNKYSIDDFSVRQLRMLKNSILKNIDIDILINPYFDYKQMKEISLGLEDNLNVRLFAYPEFYNFQMKSIRKSLKEKRFRRKDYFDTEIINGKIKYIPKDFFTTI